MAAIRISKKGEALAIAILASVILMLTFGLASNAVGAKGVSANATTTAESGLRVKPFPTNRRATTTGEEVRQRIREDRRDRIASTSVEVRARVTAAAKERAKAHLTRVVRRLEAAVDRFEKLSARAKARIEKLDRMGVDTSKAKELLAKAQAKIGAADAAVATLKASIETTISADNPREIFGEVKERIRLAIKAVREAHRALVAAIVAIKAAGGPAKADANAGSVEGNAPVGADVPVPQ